MKENVIPMISIIIPHYNNVQGLYKLLHSIPDADKIQVIIIDDNSAIDFGDLKKGIETLGRVNTEIYKNDGKRGAGNCRNVGLKYARGGWILFADSDDFFVLNAFEIILDMAEKREDIIYFTPTSIDLPEETPGNRHMPYAKMVQNYLSRKNRGSELSLKSGFVVPWSKMYKRKFLSDHDIVFEDVRWSNDVMFSVRSAFYTDNILAINKVIYCATRSRGTLTTQKNEEEYKTRFEVYIRKYKFLESVLKKDEMKYVINAPAGKIFKAVSQGYGLNMVKYILHRYQDEGIPLFYCGVGTIKRALSDGKRDYSDRKYYTK